MARMISIISALFLITIFVCTCLFIYNSNRSNQVLPSLPGTSPPVVPQLPGLVAYLRSTKDLCESRAQAAIALLGDRPKFKKGKAWDAKVSEGRAFYDQARAEFNGCVEYLRLGLTKRFADSDSAEIAKSFESAQQRRSTFIAWVNSLEGRRTVSQTSATNDYIDLFKELMNSANQRNDKALEQLRQDLEKCRFRAWNELY